MRQLEHAVWQRSLPHCWRILCRSELTDRWKARSSWSADLLRHGDSLKVSIPTKRFAHARSVFSTDSTRSSTHCVPSESRRMKLRFRLDVAMARGSRCVKECCWRLSAQSHFGDG